VLAPLVYMLVGLLIYAVEKKLSGLVVFAILSFLLFLLSPAYWRWSVRRRLQRLLSEGQNAGLGKGRLIIRPNGLRVTKEGADNALNWSYVEKIVESETHVYIYISAVSALMIPKLAFASDAEREHFVEIARQYREVAAGLRPAILSDR